MCEADEEAGRVRSELILPPVDAAEHLVGYLFSVGPGSAGEVVSYQEIAAWSDLTGRRLTGWEAETLHHLSSAYMSEYQAAEKADRPAPFSPAERVVSREEVSRRLLETFMRLAGQDAARETPTEDA